MTVQKKLPSDIEENIQNLAGDIYLQIEDKITALLTGYRENIEITPDVITQHPLYIELKEQQQSHDDLISKSQQEYKTELITLQTEKAKQQAQLAQLQDDLSNAEKLNSAKLTDSEQILKDKLAENSRLVKQVAALNKENAAQQQSLKEIGFETENATQQLKALATEHASLEKNDKAKAATLAVQNQQYSELQLNFEQVSSELEYLKAEQEHKLLSSHKQLTQEQQQAGQLSEQITALQKELKSKQTHLDEQQESMASQTHENNDLLTKVKSLEQTIVQLEQNDKTAQQQYEAQKQQSNAKWLSEQEKNAKILKQLATDNEQTLKQIHDVERDKQTLENELSSMKAELAALGKQQVQALDTIEVLEQNLQKEQTATAKISNEKSRLEASLLKAQQGYSKDNAMQKQKNTDLEKQLASIAIEHKEAQQTIANLTVQCQEQSEQITLLVEQAKNEQLKYKQTIDKQNENYKKSVAEHKNIVADKSATHAELQHQAEQKIQTLTEQLEHQAVQSAKLSELQQLYATALENTDKAERNLHENQQQLMAVQAELAKDRAITSKSKLLHQENKEKQEVEYNKARETIKYLRDENTELNRKLIQQVNELEDKLTEYRLRFDYAQKQLTKLSK